jgi:hypothetical protein
MTIEATEAALMQAPRELTIPNASVAMAFMSRSCFS